MKKLVALFTLLFALSACGGGGGGRPSQDDIAKALKDSDNPAGSVFQSGGTSDDVIDCIAKALHDSDLSDDALQALVDGDKDFDGSKKDQEVISSGDLTDEIGKCVTS
ncbi:hypothetical protein G5V58_10585 [Nocardioides anomalus]|uniref:DUF732 domain-containing protein n=1 Tax=Nocardioides anomalus TaxID=2712223 RepID=A0A6G6WDB8_9ACTN|nr:hypothetical protein [Nocardioides anomalus]QIG43147.1 hypothetical protein G5V58_10585 [Nocardioides anomalus]